MKIIVKEKIRAFTAVVFDEDGARNLRPLSDFKFFLIATHDMKLGDEVEYKMLESTNDFIAPFVKRYILPFGV